MQDFGSDCLERFSCPFLKWGSLQEEDFEVKAGQEFSSGHKFEIR